VAVIRTLQGLLAVLRDIVREAHATQANELMSRHNWLSQREDQLHKRRHVGDRFARTPAPQKCDAMTLGEQST
jgi:hypothetical protein